MMEADAVCIMAHSTVTDLARFRGQSTLQPRRTAMWYDRSCIGITVKIPYRTDKDNWN